MKKEDREKLLEEVLNKRRNISIDESMKIIESTENELNRLLSANKKDINELVKDNGDVSSEVYLSSLKKEMESDLGTAIEAPENVVVGKASKEVFDKINKEL
mgnify:FL=1